MVDSVNAFWLLAHYEPGVSELALRDSGFDCRTLLWMDLAQDWLDFCVSHRACIGGRDLAFLVQDWMKWKEGNEAAFGPSGVFRVVSGRNISPIRTYL